MSNRTTFTAARANFATLCDRVIEDREVIIISRRNSRDVALVAADELSGLLETAHLLRSPNNAQRLLTTLNRAKTNRSKAQSVKRLRRDIRLCG